MNTPIYLDNAATTPMAPEVVEAMLPYMYEHFGNPSSTHAFGRKTKTAIELARRSIAKHIGALPSEICFTSGGTEADNIALRSAVYDFGVERIITTAIEHSAVIKTAQILCEKEAVELVLLDLDAKGNPDLKQLAELLADGKKSIVSLMHGNNEIANILPLREVGLLCEKHNAYFHSDTVQTMGHYDFDFSDFPIHFATCAGHKFHGPKGIGFLYVSRRLKINSLISGGGQERQMRGGTENISAIVGLSKAFDLAYTNLREHEAHVSGLKQYMAAELREKVPGVLFNGESESAKSLYTVLNFTLPPHPNSAMFLFLLDIEGIACSGGSACSSGSNIGSHVLQGIGANKMDAASLRFSFSRYTTKECVDKALVAICDLVAVPVS